MITLHFMCSGVVTLHKAGIGSMIPVIEIIRSDPTSCNSMVHCTNLILIAVFYFLFFRVTVERKST